jgi:hypothetical protein
MESKIKDLLALRDFMQAQDSIRVISVGRSGVVKIAYDAERVSVDEATGHMRKCGVSDFDASLDWRSSCVFVTINPSKIE